MGLNHTKDKEDGENGEMSEESHNPIQIVLKAVVQYEQVLF